MLPNTTGCRRSTRPLTQAVRRLIQAGIRTGEDEETIREAQTAIEAVVQKLEGTVDEGLPRHAVNGRPVVWGNPVTGFRNADRAAAHHARGSGWLVVE